MMRRAQSLQCHHDRSSKLIVVKKNSAWACPFSPQHRQLSREQSLNSSRFACLLSFFSLGCPDIREFRSFCSELEEPRTGFLERVDSLEHAIVSRLHLLLLLGFLLVAKYLPGSHDSLMHLRVGYHFLQPRRSFQVLRPSCTSIATVECLCRSSISFCCSVAAIAEPTFRSPSSLFSPDSPAPAPDELALLDFLIVCFFFNAGVAFFEADEAYLLASPIFRGVAPAASRRQRQQLCCSKLAGALCAACTLIVIPLWTLLIWQEAETCPSPPLLGTTD